MKTCFSLIVAVFFLSCSTVNPVYDPEVTVERYFRYAQDERNRKNYENALLYYDIIINNFTNRPDKVVSAEFEKGSLYLRMKKYKQALELFDTVIAKANNPSTAQAVSPAVAYLVRDLKQKVEEKLK